MNTRELYTGTTMASRGARLQLYKIAARLAVPAFSRSAPILLYEDRHEASPELLRRSEERLHLFREKHGHQSAPLLHNPLRLGSSSSSSDRLKQWWKPHRRSLRFLKRNQD
ncbi:hypothetical protein CRENBAI_021920 [Crenichthys baileyi]|uniref:Uncharacterized protein n=1 Tax=Crenichthys baileyi TaxID=28760 RepID=A0AAV9QW53_9TELE